LLHELIHKHTGGSDCTPIFQSANMSITMSLIKNVVWETIKIEEDYGNEL